MIVRKLSLFLLLLHLPFQAAAWAKVELAPAYIHLDVIEGNRTKERVDMVGARLDGTYSSCGAYFLRSTVLFGKKEANSLVNGTLSAGLCWPFTPRLLITPSVGINLCRSKSELVFDGGPYGTLKYQQIIDSWGPVAILEATYTLQKGLRASASAQYSFSWTRTEIKKLLKCKGDASGPSFAFMVEQDLGECWSANLGMGYNLSLSKEKHGLRALGLKLGLARWF